jgi:hypothetical protein
MLDGLAFPECPRWRDDRLWFSDQHAKHVYAMDLDGKAEVIVDVAGQPSGLGWLPDGRMLVVSMNDRRVMRREPDGSSSNTPTSPRSHRARATTWWSTGMGARTWATLASTSMAPIRSRRPHA